MKKKLGISVKRKLSFMLFELSLWVLPLQAASFDPPIMGWSSWNTYRIHINEELIYKQTDALLDQGLREAGYRYINIDDGFFGYRAMLS